MNKIKTPYRYDHVGSFLRPDYLKQARLDFEKGIISEEKLKEIEDEAIKDVINKQKTLGYKIITDGEFRRKTWHLDFMWDFVGIGHTPTTTGLPFNGEAAMIDDTYITGKLEYKGHHRFIDHFKFVKNYEDENTVAKLTIPAPAQFLEQFIMPNTIGETNKYYKDTTSLKDDIIKIYTSFINDLYKSGCRNLQLDDCSWGLLVDSRAPLFFNTDEDGLNKIKEEFLDINNKVIENAPLDLIINTHVCRGNFHSTYASSGAYDKVAKYLFAREKVNAFYLEYDDSRSGSFEALKEIPEGKKVVLGLITTKSPKLEDKEFIKSRIKEASNYVNIKNLYLSPQCGCASCEIGNKLSEDEEWAKLKLVKEIAREVWNEE